MKDRKTIRTLAMLTVVAALACATAFAGGPLAIFDPATKTPYSWPGANAPVYTDLGALGQLTNAQANAMVQFSINQWNAVPTSSFTGAIAGDFASIGLPDIDASNVGLVLGPWNGGGVHIVYDADGSITDSIFGPYSGVLGFTTIEYVGDAHPDILEVTMILSGSSVPEPPTSASVASQQFAGVVTHEFGHAINLAHSQTNGQIILYYDPWSGPAGCDTPYAGFPSSNDIDTMYPFTNLSQTGIAESTVDVTDDKSALSDIYPGAGWPAAYPSIRGTIYVPERANTPQRTAFTGANIIARNVANPWMDAISAISGDFSQGMAGPDGAYAFHGLTPGASYVVYVDGVLYGAFSTPYRTVLPGPEEYWNGAAESGDGVTDDRCAWQAIHLTAGSAAIADVTFNKFKGAPELIPIDLPNSSIAELSGDGQVAIGYSDLGLIRWTPSGTDIIGGDYRSPQMAISRDGRTLVASTSDADGNVVAGIWMGGQDWMGLGGLPGGSSCDGDLSSGWGVSDDRTVVGLGWLGCTSTSGFRWTSATGMTSLGNLGSADFGASRADRISADASTIVGWDRDDTGFWRGAIWHHGQESIVHQPPALCCDGDGCLLDTVGEAGAVNPDGSIVLGDYYSVPRVYEDPFSGDVYHYCDSVPWRLDPGTGLAEPIGGYLPDFGLTTHAFDLSDDGGVLVGRADPFDWGASVPLIWTAPTGWMDFQGFLASQGTLASDWLLLTAGTVSADGTVVGGWGYSPFSRQGWIVNMPKVVICHAPKGNPSNKRTIDVAWPGGLADHLAHGDTIGLCGNGQ
ncbi:MAG: hypothetical protein LAO51_13455 [Acidobacteriia bacterium]|nr:hypothetical protein [Terriglobia bacterium]